MILKIEKIEINKMKLKLSQKMKINLKNREYCLKTVKIYTKKLINLKNLLLQ